MTTQRFIPVQGTGKNMETIEHVDDNGDTVHREAVYMGGILDAQKRQSQLHY
jgi:hypothetical protein